jgi:hypothetical protein
MKAAVSGGESNHGAHESVRHLAAHRHLRWRGRLHLAASAGVMAYRGWHQPASTALSMRWQHARITSGGAARSVSEKAIVAWRQHALATLPARCGIGFASAYIAAHHGTQPCAQRNGRQRNQCEIIINGVMASVSTKRSVISSKISIWRNGENGGNNGNIS